MRYLITAGPTREPIDPVRYLGNRSSGKMGYALAEAALAAGHQVILITGPTSLAPPDRAEVTHVETAREMYEAVSTRIGEIEVAIFCAAVSDYRVAETSLKKMKKTGDPLTLPLVENPDILGSARDHMGFQGFLVGFAAETDRVIENARQKLQRKQCDMLVANDVSQPGIGFEADQNEIAILTASGGNEILSKTSKTELARQLIERIDRQVADAASSRN